MSDFEIQDGVLVKYTGNGGEVVIPDGVTSIGDGVFENCSSLTSIKIPNSVTKIEDHAFSGCRSLTSIVIPDSVKNIGWYAFENCSSLTSITIPDSGTGIQLWFNLFEGCDNLTTFEVGPVNSNFTAENGFLLSKDRTKLLICAPGLSGSVSVPTTVTEIAGDAFQNCEKIEKITLPEGLAAIGMGAFFHCSRLENINLPEKITILPEYCFSGCNSLKEIDLSHVVRLGKSAFHGCSNLRMTIPSNVSSIDRDAFEGCNPSNLTFEEGSGYWGEGAFGRSVKPEKELHPYPNLPLNLFGKPEEKLWLVMGYCSDPDAYSGYILDQYKKYAKAQRKRILKKAQEDKLEKVLAYYGESSSEKEPEPVFEKQAISLQMTAEEAKKLFKYSKRAAVISISGFKNIEARWKSQGNYDAHFLRGANHRLVLPDCIDGKKVGHIALAMLPDDAVIICNELVFPRLKRAVKATTACAYLAEPNEFPKAEAEEIKKFLAKYPSDVVGQLIDTGNVQVVSGFLDLVQVSPKLLDEMSERVHGNVELTALLLNQKDKTEKSEAEKGNRGADDLGLDLSAEEKALPIAELRKQWTFSTYTTYGDNNEFVELSHYKGAATKVVVPAQFGKYRIGRIEGALLEGHYEVTELVLPDGDYEVKIHLGNCKRLADPEGFIVVHAGIRAILTDYIGNTCVDTLTIPEGVTEIDYHAFKNLYVREVIVPGSCSSIGAFNSCPRLQKAVIHNGVEKLYGFRQCDALRDLYIPESAAEINIGPLNSQCRIHGKSGTKAEFFAKANDLPFVEETAPE